MKLAIPFLSALAIATSQVVAQAQSSAPGGPYGPTDSSHGGLLPDKYTNPYSGPSTGPGTNSQNASAAAPTGTPDQSNTYEGDDTLYRGRTGESLGQEGLREEGPLHFKRHPKEKIQEVNSLKSLQSSAPDRKFEGSLLHSSVTSIADIAAKSGDNGEAEADRFQRKQLTFKRGQDDQPQKTQGESSPSPTPSATASPQKKDSSRVNP
jgi:hypothetical protein